MKDSNQTKLIIFVLLFASLFIQVAQAQAQSTTFSAYTDLLAKRVQPTNCEENTSILTAIHNEAGKEGLILVISRLGTGERQEFHKRRLYNAQHYLAEFGGRDSKTIILAQGENVQGNGRVELYASSLFDILSIAPNRDLNVGICKFEENESPCADDRQKKLYPCLNKKLKIKNKR